MSGNVYLTILTLFNVKNDKKIMTKLCRSFVCFNVLHVFPTMHVYYPNFLKSKSQIYTSSCILFIAGSRLNLWNVWIRRYKKARVLFPVERQRKKWLGKVNMFLWTTVSLNWYTFYFILLLLMTIDIIKSTFFTGSLWRKKKKN